jgi:hypothetical protein
MILQSLLDNSYIIWPQLDTTIIEAPTETNSTVGYSKKDVFLCGPVMRISYYSQAESRDGSWKGQSW